MRVGLYTRVSTQEQAQEGYSIDAQLERLTAYCKAKDWHIVHTYTDAGFSGSNLNRPAMQQLINDIDSGTFDTVLVYKLDRISRSQKDTLFLIEDVFLKNNISFISVNENFDTSTAFGRAMIGILSVFAQLEREQIKERTRMGLEERVRKGKHHSFAPFGYRLKDKELVICEPEADVVRIVYDMTLQNKTAKVINDYVVENYPEYKALFTTKNNKVYDIIHNITYGGYVKFGDKISKGAHEAIIDDITYAKVQKILQKKAEIWETSRTKRTGTRSYYLLTGFVFCGNCGARLRVIKPSSGGKYSCYSRIGNPSYMVKDPNCRLKVYELSELDNIVLDELKKLKSDEEYFNSLCRPTIVENKADKISKELNRIEIQINKLLDLYQMDDIDVSLLTNRMKQLNNKKKKLENEISASKQDSLPKLTYRQALDILSDLDSYIEKGATDQLRELLQMLIDRITVYDDRVEIKWSFS